MNGLSLAQLNHYGASMRSFFQVQIFMLLVCLLALFATCADAATTFTSSVTNADGELNTVLSWQSDRVACTASGHPEWSGAKPPTGTLTLPTITLSGTYTLTIACQSPGDQRATVRWTAPTENTDGTPLTNLAGFRLYHSQQSNAIGASTPVTKAADATSHVFTDLAPGTWYFGAVAFNTQGAVSVMSNTASKTTTAASSDPVETVTLTVNPIPASPGALEVE